MQKLQLSIPEPCHENWQQMTPTDQGRFCNARAKEVVNFSTMTDMQVLNYFSTGTHEKVCGRALPEQLDRTISRPVTPKKRLFWYWNYIVMFFMFFGKGNAAKAQGGVKAVTEINPVKANDEVVVVGGYMVRRTSQLITGKVRDTDGNPVPFASINVKGKPIAVAADANGEYSVRAEPGNTLMISVVGFNTVEVLVGANKFINVTLEKKAGDLRGEIVIAASSLKRTPGKIEGAIAKTDTVKVNPEKTVNISQALAGKVSGVRINMKNATKPETRITLRGAISVRSSDGPLLVVDDVLRPDSFIKSLNPNDIEKVTVLQGASASALYGSEAVNGVIIVTTKKLKVKNLDTVTVTASATIKGSIRMGAMVSGVTVKRSITDTLKLVATKITGAIKIYPNPVQRGNTFNISIKLKQTGLYQIQITDVAARVVLQKQIRAVTKEFTEKILPGNNWSSGVYYISIIDNKNKLVNKSSFIFN